MKQKILVDEMDDGMDDKLNALGYEAYSVKKLRTEGKKLATDYSIINYAKENKMILVTRDTESGKACQENDISCILLDNNEIFKIVVEKLKQLQLDDLFIVRQVKKNMDSCDVRTRAYKNGKTFDQCKEIAESTNTQLKQQIEEHGNVAWSEILSKVDHDELVYKLTLKYLRRDGYDIGNSQIPEVKKFTSQVLLHNCHLVFLVFLP